MEVEAIDPQGGNAGFARAVKDCVAGTFGGIVQVVVGQPFDTVKVRLQTQSTTAPEYAGAWDCVKKMRAREGASAFYKGTLTPLIGVGACVSIQFGALEYAKRALARANEARGHADPTRLGIGQLALAGAGAGLANSVVSGPVEHIRTRLQVQTSSGPGQAYRGPGDAIRKIYAQRGLPGIFKGQGVTMWREAIGYGIYFGVYEHLVQQSLQRSGKTRAELPAWQSCMFGAASGYILWIGIFPIDAIKSKIQTDSLVPGEQRYRGMVDCARQVVSAQGVAGLFRGFIPCMVRAGPANAATFVAVEAALKVIGRD